MNDDQKQVAAAAENLVDSLEGWKGVEAQSQTIEMSEEDKLRASLFASYFSSDLGQKVLSYIKKRTIECSTLPSVASDGIHVAVCNLLRSGENALCFWIMEEIEKGKNIHG